MEPMDCLTSIIVTRELMLIKVKLSSMEKERLAEIMEAVNVLPGIGGGLVPRSP